MYIKYILIGVFLGLLAGYFFLNVFILSYKNSERLLRRVSSSHYLIFIIGSCISSAVTGLFYVAPIVLAHIYEISIDNFKFGYMTGTFIGIVIYKSTHLR